MNFSLKNNPAIAVVLTDKDVLAVEKDELAYADLIELRVDMFEDFKNIEEIFITANSKFRIPILATVRIPSEGGQKIFPERIELYRRVLPYSEFADVEIFSEDASSLGELIRQQNKIMIASYHRFDITPSVDELVRVYEEGKRLGGDIIKIATMVNDNKDLETLLFFTLRYRENPIIVIGMGDRGRTSRIIMPCLGCLITYASLRIKSAPGQISLKDLVYIFRVLGLR